MSSDVCQWYSAWLQPKAIHSRRGTTHTLIPIFCFLNYNLRSARRNGSGSCDNLICGVLVCAKPAVLAPYVPQDWSEQCSRDCLFYSIHANRNRTSWFFTWVLPRDKDINFSIPQKTIEWNCSFCCKYWFDHSQSHGSMFVATSSSSCNNLAGRSWRGFLAWNLWLTSPTMTRYHVDIKKSRFFHQYLLPLPLLENPDWQRSLDRTRKGIPKQTLANCANKKMKLERQVQKFANEAIFCWLQRQSEKKTKTLDSTERVRLRMHVRSKLPSTSLQLSRCVPWPFQAARLHAIGNFRDAYWKAWCSVWNFGEAIVS